MMNDNGLTISQLRTLLRILPQKIGATLCEPEYLMKALNDDMILPKVGEYNYYHEAGSKPELILFWIRDNVAVYKKET